MLNNVLNVAKKEFVDLVYSKIIIISLIVYFIMLSNSIYSSYIFATSDYVYENNVNNIFFGLLYVLINYGSIVAIIVGFSSLSIEKRGNSLNTLITKPLYRDTIINGKFIGCLLFIVLIFFISSLIYMVEAFILFNNINITLNIFLSNISLILIVSLICVSIFLSISIFMSVIIKEDVFALFMSILIWIFTMRIMSSTSFASNISYLFGADRMKIEEFIVNLGPDVIAFNIFKNANDILSIFSNNASDFIKLLLYVAVIVILCYIAFMRSDIS